MARTFDAIIFDFDGVILDTRRIKTAAFMALYREQGKAFMRRVALHHLEHGGISRYKKLPLYQEWAALPSDVDTVERLARQFSELVFGGVVEAAYIDGAEELLDAVKWDYDLFVCTGTPQVEIDRVIEARKLGAYFVEVAGSPRTKPVIIRDLLNTYDLNPKKTLFIGDALTDLHSAAEVGLPFVGVRNEDTEFPEGTPLVSNLTELLPYFVN